MAANLSPPPPAATLDGPSNLQSALAKQPSRRWIPLALCVCFLWFILINQLRWAWAADPQYSYGFIVPILALVLALRRWFDPSQPSALNPQSPGLPQPSTINSQLSGPPQPLTLNSQLVFAALAFLILPLRLILEANPDWRIMNWLLAFDVVALTLALIFYIGGSNLVRQLAFPVAYILVAVPWPFTIEHPVIQGLTRANVSVVIEVMTLLGIPAIQHGNLVEVASGTVGVDEACSGIRSLQSSIMISLFMGEFYWLRLWRRILLLPVGLLVAFCFNVCRTTILTWLAAKNGVDAIAEYHDSAGLTILVACTLGLMGVAWVLDRGQRSKVEGQRGEVALRSTLHGPSSVSGPSSSPWSVVSGLSLALFIWVLASELAVESWYRWHEPKDAAVPQWTLKWPMGQAGFEETTIAPRVTEILGYDEGHSGKWQTGGSVDWTINYFRWNPGKQQAWLSGIHRPDVCMASMGQRLREEGGKKVLINVGSMELPFQLYTYDYPSGVLHVFHCFWEQRSSGQNRSPVEPDKWQRLRAARNGQRNLGQQTIQVSVRGIEDEAAATKALAEQISNAIVVQKLLTLLSSDP